MTARELEHKVTRVERGEVIGNVHELPFRDPNHFRAGELHAHHSFWESVAEGCPEMATQNWIGSDINFLFFRFFNILKVRLKVCSTILTVHLIRYLKITCQASLSLAVCRKP